MMEGKILIEFPLIFKEKILLFSLYNPLKINSCSKTIIHNIINQLYILLVMELLVKSNKFQMYQLLMIKFK